jgi:hypothetical protein
MPGSFPTFSTYGVPNVPRSMPVVRSPVDSVPYEYPYAISGITLNSSGAALPACSVVLYRTADNSVAGRVTSDASGNYRVDASPAVMHYVVAYQPGSPDVAGTTVNTLIGS